MHYLWDLRYVRAAVCIWPWAVDESCLPWCMRTPTAARVAATVTADGSIFGAPARLRGALLLQPSARTITTDHPNQVNLPRRGVGLEPGGPRVVTLIVLARDGPSSSDKLKPGRPPMPFSGVRMYVAS